MPETSRITSSKKESLKGLLLSKLRAIVSHDPVVLGWTRRLYVSLGFGEKNESDYLFDLARSEKGIFVLQVGANDGKRHDSVSPFIHKYRWQGLLLEPLPDIFETLRLNYANRSNVVLINAALADRDGEMTFYRVRPGPEVPDNCNELGSFYRDVILKHTYLFPQIEKYISTQIIEAVSFPTLVQRHNVQKIDALIVDTEGFDFEILKLADFQRFRPKVVIYEHMHLNKEDQEAARQLLADLDYDVHPLRKSGDANTVAIDARRGKAITRK